ncbi:hypothetical protein NLX69_17285 [Rossellomorea sp. BNER]|nr:hypothetical protein [Rossellomorea sp. BNER]
MRISKYKYISILIFLYHLKEPGTETTLYVVGSRLFVLGFLFRSDPKLINSMVDFKTKSLTAILDYLNNIKNKGAVQKQKSQEPQLQYVEESHRNIFYIWTIIVAPDPFLDSPFTI